MAVGEKDVLGSLLVYAEAGVEEEVEGGNDEGGVPSCARPPRQDILLKWLGKVPLEDLGPG